MTLKDLGITASRISGKTGVWLQNPERKICSIGVKISRWCTFHGLSLNVHKNNKGFDLINPCGFKDITITSTEEEGVNIEMKKSAELLTENFLKVFRFDNISD